MNDPKEIKQAAFNARLIIKAPEILEKVRDCAEVGGMIHDIRLLFNNFMSDMGDLLHQESMKAMLRGFLMDAEARLNREQTRALLQEIEEGEQADGGEANN